MPRRVAKRRNGDGSISYRKTEKRWAVRVSIPVDSADPNGPKMRVTRYAKTRDEARDLLAALRRDVTVGDTEDLKPRPTSTLDEYVTHWRNHRLALDILNEDLRTTTADHYVRCIRIYVIPILGPSRKISSLRATDVDSITSSLNRDGKSAATRRQAIIALRKMASAAADEGLLNPKYAAEIHPPKRPKRGEIARLTTEQAAGIAGMLVTARHDARGAAALQLYTGCRRSEALAARWDGFDNLGTPGAAVWHITRSVVESDSGGLVFGEPKTGYGRRTVQLPEPLRELLYELRKARPETVFVAESRFSHGDEPRPVMPSNYSRWLRTVFSSFGAEGNSHAMRHCYAMTALRAGVPLVTVSRALGHSSIAITADIYMQPNDRDLRNAADAVAGAFAAKPEEEETEAS